MRFSTLKLIDEMLSSFIEQIQKDADEAIDPFEVEALEKMLVKYSQAYTDFKVVDWH